MITITASSGRKGRGETVADACRQLLGDRLQAAVQTKRGLFVPVDDVTADDVRRTGVLWAKKACNWKVVLLVDQVVEAQSSMSGRTSSLPESSPADG